MFQGAGDSFIGALAYFLSIQSNAELAKLAEKAVQIASVSVQKPGTQISYPSREDLPQELFSL